MSSFRYSRIALPVAVGVLISACSESENVLLGPDAVCEAAWNAPAAVAVVDTLSLATAPMTAVWVEYQGSDSHFVLHAGPSDEGGECLALLRGGKVIDYATLHDAPRLRTPLYGYHFGYEAQGGTMPELSESSRQPPSIVVWLGEHNVRSATLLPVRPADFPIELPALVTAQVALHEAFHVDVQSPRWMGYESSWPTWDAQPDRASVAMCHSGEPEIEAAFAEERSALFGMVQALLDDDVDGACGLAAEFLDARERRMALVAQVQITQANGRPGSCALTEAILELEEGIADYVSWVRLFDSGLASRVQLERRYQAQQNDVFYLTGAMKMHVAGLLSGEPLEETRVIAASASPIDGSPQARLAAALAGSCQGRSAGP